MIRVALTIIDVLALLAAGFVACLLVLAALVILDAVYGPRGSVRRWPKGLP